MKPPRLRKGDQMNFETLLRAASDGALALVSAVRKADQQSVALVCAMQTNDDETTTPIPFAVMVERNPFDLSKIRPSDGHFIVAFASLIGHPRTWRHDRSNFCTEETSCALSKPTQHSTARS